MGDAGRLCETASAMERAEMALDGTNQVINAIFPHVTAGKWN